MSKALDWLDRVRAKAIAETVDLESPPVIPEPAQVDRGADRDMRGVKPCCARIRNVDGKTGWCVLGDGHERLGMPDHHGVSFSELPTALDFGPDRAIRNRGAET